MLAVWVWVFVSRRIDSQRSLAPGISKKSIHIIIAVVMKTKMTFTKIQQKKHTNLWGVAKPHATQLYNFGGCSVKFNVSLLWSCQSNRDRIMRLYADRTCFTHFCAVLKCIELFSWLKKHLCLSDPDMITNIALEVTLHLAAKSLISQKSSLTEQGHHNNAIGPLDILFIICVHRVSCKRKQLTWWWWCKYFQWTALEKFVSMLPTTVKKCVNNE